MTKQCALCAIEVGAEGLHVTASVGYGDRQTRFYCSRFCAIYALISSISRDIADDEKGKALRSFAQITDYASLDRNRTLAWVGDLSRAVLRGDREAIAQLYKETER